MKFPDKINILGTNYTIEIRDHNEDSELEDCSGYTVLSQKLIVICDFFKHWHDAPRSAIKNKMKETLRHELIHAFLNESGLNDSSIAIANVGWARNEEMIDWFAIQSPKIYKAFKECGCLR